MTGVIVYLLKTNGDVMKLLDQHPERVNLLTGKNINPQYEEMIHLHPITEFTRHETCEDDFFLVMSDVNRQLSFGESYNLEINLALRRYFPDSPFVGDLLVIRINNEDEFVNGDWSLDELFSHLKMSLNVDPITKDIYVVFISDNQLQPSEMTS